MYWDLVSGDEAAADLHTKRQNKGRFSKLCLTNRLWAKLYRPKVWEEIALYCHKDVYDFASILRTAPPKGFPPVWTYVKELWAIVDKETKQPWIHLIALVLRHPLLSERVQLKYRLVAIEKGGGLVDGIVTKHLTQKLLPRTILGWNIKCKRLHLHHLSFPSMSKLIRILDETPELQVLELKNTSWANNALPNFTRIKPLCTQLREVRHINMDVNPDSLHLFWFMWVATRYVQSWDKLYALNEYENEIAMQISAAACSDEAASCATLRVVASTSKEQDRSASK